jgi:hypothetical protein
MKIDHIKNNYQMLPINLSYFLLDFLYFLRVLKS